MRLTDGGRFTAFWALGILALGALSVSTGLPTATSPYSLVTVIPAFLVGSTPLNAPELPFRNLMLSLLAALPVTFAFLLWVWPASARGENVPKRSKLALFVMLVLMAGDFLLSWKSGFEYRGATHTVLMVFYNAAFAAAALFLLRRGQSMPSARKVAAFHGVLFCWMAWCAFPYLGELP